MSNSTYSTYLFSPHQLGKTSFNFTVLLLSKSVKISISPLALSNCIKNFLQVPQGIPPFFGGFSLHAINLLILVFPVLIYIFKAATLSAHKFITPLALSIQNPVKISPSSLSTAETT